MTLNIPESVDTSSSLAWQRQIREQRAAVEAAESLLGAYWDDLDLSIENARVMPIQNKQAATIIEQYEWMGRMPAIPLCSFGIYFDGILGGAVVYSPEYGENLGIWDQYGFTGKIILLSRGACVHWAHEHAASKLIRGSMKLLPRKYSVVTATVDEMAGEIGTIYQACGFTYVGRMRAENPRSSGSWATRTAIEIDGKLFTERTLRHRYGTQDKEQIVAMFPNAKFVQQQAKGRYFAFRGSKGTRRAHARSISDLARPYPKRATT